MESHFVKRTIVKDSVPSRLLAEGERGLRILLPPGYNELLSYPVIYCQDGEDFFNFGRIATQAAGLIMEGELEPLIIVGVDVDKSKRTSEYSPAGSLHQAYVLFFAEELVPYIESRYPVRREPDQILLAGDSLGAAVCFHIALAYPERFSRLLSLSGAFYPDSLAIIKEFTDSLSWLHMLMIVGLQETDFESDSGRKFNFVELNREAKSILERKGAHIHYSEKDGRHQWGFWQAEVPQALRWFMKQQ